ncbi:MAG: cell division protein FtsA [Coprobacter sp.]|nr:cell division protein FtsA [Coprobacter sp.]
METGKYIAAIELGTAKIVGIIGQKKEDGTLHVLAIEQEESSGCIKRGCIQNVEETASRVKKIITKLGNRTTGTIEQMYVGIGGQSVRTINHTVRKQLPEDTQVTEELIRTMHSEGRTFPVYNAEILKIVPNEYLLDNQLETHPVGIFCSDIEARLKLIVGRPSIRKNIARCLTERCKMPVAGYIVSAQATAAALLTEDEKNLGCALIDFGAGTTTLSIYKDNLLRYLITIPFGGRNITKDISSLNILDSEAENLKITFGSAINNSDMQKHELRIDGLDSSKIKYQDLCRIIEPRIEEIVENVHEQIDVSGYADQLARGIIITGGASLLRELPELLTQKTGMKVRRGSIPRTISFANRIEGGKPAYSQAIGLLMLGEENCIGRKISTAEPVGTATATAATAPQEQEGQKVQKVQKVQKPKNPDNSFLKRFKNKAKDTVEKLRLFEDDDAELI